ncbi:hypothetical protein Pcinc_023630 [Petrolisthes cinctipes]|uniref:CCHC-type domain-containing protein n=1 Tax=Petrolisthes cinctipes TaxID=88211 RepID=A0AAE1FCK3_PETCI|nr:hypothetical protein Pcinc_023630 [Petrolisthes cinctipes]
MDASGNVAANTYNDSDFQSEDEDAEFRLYTQLYFIDQDDLSTNCNNVPDQGCNIPNDIVHTNLQVYKGESVSTPEKTDDVQNAFVTTDKKSAEDIPVAAEKTHMEDVSLTTMEKTNVKYESVVREKSNVQDTLDTASTDTLQGNNIFNKIDSLLSVKSRSTLNDKCAAKISLASKERSKTIEQSNIDLFPSSTCNKDTANCHKFKNSHEISGNILASKRNRLSSLCSEGSIPGSLPLDALYCNFDLDDDILEEDVEDKSKSFNPESVELQQIPTASKRTKSRKRKICETENILQEDSEEDSKAATLVKLNQRLKKQEYIQRKKPKSVVKTESDISCITESNARDHEVLDLITSSDDSDIKVISTTYSSPQKNKLMNGKKPHFSDFNSSFQQTCSSKSVRHGIRTNNNLGSDVNVLSDTDDDFYDIEVVGGGTDLIFNVSNSLSSFVNKLSKPSSTTLSLVKNKKKAKRKVLYVRRSVDYTLNRPDTKTKPSCDKWTQEMTNFYDSDVSEDCDVSDIHQQQSDSPADWSVISADYWSYLNKSKRYYSRDRCTLCRQFGHSRNDCTKVPHCYLCSKTDHSNRRDCPHNCCFKCGGPFHHFCAYTLRSVMCTRCGFSGHRQDQCPVNWRSYYVTVSGRVAVARESEPTSRIYCCHCSRMGHFNYMCTQWHHSVNTYLPVPQAIFTPQSKMVDYVEAMEGNKELRNEYTTHSTAQKLQKVSVQRFTDKKQKRALLANNGAIVKELEMKSGTKMQVESVKQRGVVYIEGTNDAVTRAVNMLKMALKNVKNVNTAFQTVNADWCYNFLKKVNRNKTVLLKELQNYIAELWNPVYVSEKILLKKLKRVKYYYDLGQKCNMPKNDKERYTRRRDLKMISMLLASHVDQTVIQHISELREEVKYYSSSIIPESLCEKISVTLASVFAPPVEAIENILTRAFFNVKSLSVDMTKISKERRTKYDFNMYDMNTYENIDLEPVPRNSVNVLSLTDKQVENLMAKQNRKKSKKLKKMAKAKRLKGKFSEGKESGTPEECELTVLQGEPTHDTQQQQHEENIAQMYPDAKLTKDHQIHTLEESPDEKVKSNVKKERSGKVKKKKKIKDSDFSSDKTQECNMYEDSQVQPPEYLSTLKQKVKSGKVKKRKKKKDGNSSMIDDNVDTQPCNKESVVQGEGNIIGKVKKLDKKVKKKMKKAKKMEMEKQVEIEKKEKQGETEKKVRKNKKGETEKKEKQVETEKKEKQGETEKKNKKVETEKKEKKVKKDKKVEKDNQEETEKKNVKREKKAKKDKKVETDNKVTSVVNEEGSHNTQPNAEKKKKKRKKVVGCKTIKKFPNVDVVGCDTV